MSEIKQILEGVDPADTACIALVVVDNEGKSRVALSECSHAMLAYMAFHLSTAAKETIFNPEGA